MGPGVRVPYPEPTSAAASLIGRANRRRDTRAEVRLRSELHRLGLRFRIDLPIVAGGVRVRPDIVFTRAKVAVFVDGCFWHLCPDHCHLPKRNRAYWIPKLDANRARDERVTAALRSDGWHAIRVWEHEDPAATAQIIAPAVRARGPRSPRG
ncbi:very short patch repair endonuclease [Ilumatobacter sp.]|uniref:very short patch repair endonuclease n=1 Tax=Ilumatobacter sp. TaxID=1967498 RepID=UPI003B522269